MEAMHQKRIFLFLLLFFLLLPIGLHAQQQDVYDNLVAEVQKMKATTKVDKNDRRILEFLNKIYMEVLQADHGSLSKGTIDEIKAFQNDCSLANRHIFILFHRYQSLIEAGQSKPEESDPNLQLALMKVLSGELIDLYDEIPPIILIYMGEAQLNAGYREHAKTHFTQSLFFYPDSVPLKVYKYLLTDNESEKRRLFEELTEKHPNHWMVKRNLKGE